MIREVFENLSLFLLALALAIIVWIAAVNEDNPIEQRVFPRTLPIRLEGLAEDMFLVEEVDTEVTVTILAPASVWATLTSNRIDLIADLSGLDTGTHTVPLQAHVDDEQAEIVTLSENEIQVQLERITTRTLPIQVNVIGEPALGYIAGEPQLSATSVQITGPEARVDAVSEVAVQVNLDGHKEAVEETLPLRPTDSQGLFVSELTMEPNVLEVTVGIEQLESYRDVAVRASIEGEVAFGYRVTNITTAPLVVTVFSSDPEQVAALPGFVETETLDITDAQDDVEERLTLLLPEGVALVGEQAVLVQVNIAAIESSLTLKHEVEFTGLEPGLAATASPDMVELILSGPLPILDALEVEDVTVIFDVLGLEIGTYQLEPEVIIAPEGVEVVSVLPATFQIEIEESTETPTPTPGPGTGTATPSSTPTALSFTSTPTSSATAISTTTPTP